MKTELLTQVLIMNVNLSPTFLTALQVSRAFRKDSSWAPRSNKAETENSKKKDRR